MILEVLTLIFGAVHFAVPLGYYVYLKRYLGRLWNIELDDGYRPRVAVIVPTYNEATLLESRLENIRTQIYPMDKLGIMVVDSGSTDDTAEIVKRWASKNPDVKIEVVEESVRRGKAHALNIGLKHTRGDIVVLADADSLWDKDALKEALKYLSDQSVGAVTAVKEPVKTNPRNGSTIESTYRSFYNVVRVAESKIHSTPIFHGELAAFRRGLLLEIGGFPGDMGADDSHAATLVALEGYRAIAVPEALVYELTPSSWRDYVAWRVRRAKHLVQHFIRSLSGLSKAPRGFMKVLAMESFLHVINPWLLLAALTAFIASLVANGFSPLNMAILLTVLAALLIKRTRRALLTWVVNQLILSYSAIAGIRSKELIWRKIEDLRRTRVTLSTKGGNSPYEE